MSATHPTPQAEDGEEAIIRRAMLGETADFARLVTAHYERIYRLAYRFVGRKEDAEDVAQEVCIKLAHNLNSYRFETLPIGTWKWQSLNSPKAAHVLHVRLIPLPAYSI